MSNMVINTNVLALNAHRNMGRVATTQSKTSARLSSGLRINTAADDAAGLAISEKMRAQIRGLDQASRNAQDGVSLVQTAEGGMTEITEMMQRMRELTVQASNETNTSTDLAKIQLELDQLSTEITEMASRTEFNTKKLLSGGVFYLQVGANANQGITVSTPLKPMLKITLATGGADSYAMATTTDAVAMAGADPTAHIEKIDKVERDASWLDGQFGAQNSGLVSYIDAEMAVVTENRAILGAVQNRLEYTINSLDISSENLSASESRIRDADMGAEMMAYTQANVLQQAATSMLAQANQAPNNVLQLLG